MIYIIEGPDNVGKSTQGKLLYEHLNGKCEHTFYLHCSNFPTLIDGITPYEHACEYYLNLLNSTAFVDWNYIFDRSHLGEWVYGQIYRNYKPYRIFEIEKESLIPFRKVKCIFLLDEPENLIQREDGHSFSTDLDIKKKEIEYFKEAASLTNYESCIIDINKKQPIDVFSEILTFVGAV
jgi:thymidylate kinase